MSAQLHAVRSDAGPENNRRHARPTRQGRVVATRPPSTPLLTHALPVIDWSDAFAVALPPGCRRDPQEWAEAVFRTTPTPAARLLFRVREVVARCIGIERGGRHVFDTVARTDREVLLGVDQAHLGFRASVLVEPAHVVLTTVVQLRNRRGRAYFALVSRIHPVVVRRSLARAARAMAVPS